MDGIENDYGFYEDLDMDDDTIAVLVPRPSNDDQEGAFAFPIPFCCCSVTTSDPADGPLAHPPILTRPIVEAIIEEGLPWSMQDYRCDRLYSSSRDGASFGTFMRRVRGRDRTVVVATTSGGRVVGGYATDAWSGRRGRGGARVAAPDNEDGGNDGAFLFVVDPPSSSAAAAVSEPSSTAAAAAHTFIPGLEALGTSPTSAVQFDLHRRGSSPSESPRQRRRDRDEMTKKKKEEEKEKPRVEIFKPSRKSSLRQACQVGSEFISMSDGEGLSLVIENSFSCGASRIREDLDEFTIVEFEVYGFTEE